MLETLAKSNDKQATEGTEALIRSVVRVFALVCCGPTTADGNRADAPVNTLSHEEDASGPGGCTPFVSTSGPGGGGLLVGEELRGAIQSPERWIQSHVSGKAKAKPDNKTSGKGGGKGGKGGKGEKSSGGGKAEKGARGGRAASSSSSDSDSDSVEEDSAEGDEDDGEDISKLMELMEDMTATMGELGEEEGGPDWGSDGVFSCTDSEDQDSETCSSSHSWSDSDEDDSDDSDASDYVWMWGPQEEERGTTPAPEVPEQTIDWSEFEEVYSDRLEDVFDSGRSQCKVRLPIRDYYHIWT